MGIPSEVQDYTFNLKHQVCGILSDLSATHDLLKTLSGSNTYAILPAPRSSGVEAMVISAPWLSHSNETTSAPNVRGISTVLALAKFLKSWFQYRTDRTRKLISLSSEYSFWAKDLIFIISDGSLEGMHAFLSAYHGSIPQSKLDKLY